MQVAHYKTESTFEAKTRAFKKIKFQAKSRSTRVKVKEEARKKSMLAFYVLCVWQIGCHGDQAGKHAKNKKRPM